MSVNSITGNLAFNIQPLNTAVSADQSAKGASAASAQAQATNNALQAGIPDINTEKKVSSDKNESAAKLQSAGNESSNQAARVISHVVVSYNPQGKVRTKFEDSRNNVIYQIPSEMVSKMEDQMMKPETSTNTKG